MILDRVSGPRGPRGARPRPSGRRDRRSGLLGEAAPGARRSAGRARRLRRRGRRSQHRLVGRRGHLGLVHPPLRGARRRRGARRSRGPSQPLLRAARRGRHDRRLRHGHLAVGGRDLTFDEALGRQHGYDFDFCLQARAAGKKVMTADLRVVHHHSLDPARRRRGLDRGAHQGRREVGRQAARRRSGKRRLAPAGPPRRGRGGRLPRSQAGSAMLQRDAVQSQLHLTRQTTSWKLTAPLRAVTAPLRRLFAAAPRRPAAVRSRSSPASSTARLTRSRENNGSPRWRSRESRSAQAKAPDSSIARSS